MRSIDAVLRALSSVVSSPDVRRGYEELSRVYQSMGMVEEAGAVDFLISERFGADGPGADEEQH